MAGWGRAGQKTGHMGIRAGANSEVRLVQTLDRADLFFKSGGATGEFTQGLII